MLFHVIHSHTAELCPAGNKELVKNTWGKVFASAGEIGIKIVGSYVNAPAHTLYFIIDSDSVEKIERFFTPVLKMGETEINPVSNALDTIKRFS
jgi:hypothetical protein